MDARTQIELFEDRAYEAYPDPLTGGEPFTIGVGHTGPEVHQGLRWTDAEIDAAFAIDLAEADLLCRTNFEWYGLLNEPRQAVLLGMAFQMGNRLLGFHDTLANVRDEHWANAAEHMRQSRWAAQTPRRALRLAAQMETGQWA